MGFRGIATLSLSRPFSSERSHADENFFCSERVLLRFLFLCFPSEKIVLSEQKLKYLSE